MIKEAIEKIVNLSGPNVMEIGGKHFLVAKEGNYASQINPDIEFPKTLDLYSLEALVQMVKTESYEEVGYPIYINAYSHNAVTCYTQPLEALRMERGILYHVKAKDVPGWEENTSLPFEEALIAIRTRFQESVDSEYLLILLSNITNHAKITYADNGIATSIITSKGVALQENSPIRPIVKLRPYRTFQEVDQPESEFHVRITEKGIKFVEADGGMWKLAARRTIAGYLAQELCEMVDVGEVIVTI